MGAPQEKVISFWKEPFQQNHRLEKEKLLICGISHLSRCGYCLISVVYYIITLTQSEFCRRRNEEGSC